tara:strand:+ start:237 stop:1466 length:1230 start_codon:yes stop_codon:yes gene_type:complete
MKASELLEKRVKSFADAKEIINAADRENRELTAQDEERFDALMAEGESANKQYQNALRSERVAEVEKELDQPVRSLSFPATTETNSVSPYGTAKYAEDFRHFMATGERRELSIGNDGAVVPDDLLARLIQFRDQTNVMQQVTTVETFPNDVQIPREVTKAAIAGFVAEAGEAENNEPTFDAPDINAYKQFGSTTYTVEFLNDARINVTETVARQLGEAHGKNLEKYQCIGTGIAQPQGVFEAPLTGPSINQTTGAINYDNLVDMVVGTHKPQYLTNSNFVMHQTTFAHILKIKDSDGRPLIELGTGSILRDGAVATLLGYPVYLSEFAPTYDASSTDNQIAFFPPEAVLCAMRNQMTLMPDPYAGRTGVGVGSLASNASTGKVTMFSFMRWDQILARPEAVSLLRTSES